MTTAKQVAEAANVALPTAYEALRGAGRLAPETRRRVLEAATRLNYKPSAAARAMNRGQTGQIGVIGKLHPVSVEAYRGASSAILRHGKVFSLFTYDDQTLEAVQRRAFQERMFDGMIVVDQVPEELHDELVRIEHCVWANTNRNETHDCIRRDELGVGRRVGAELVRAGWPEIVFVYGPAENQHYAHADRLNGLRAVAEESGVVVHELLCPESGTNWHQLDERLAGYFDRAAFVFSDAYRVRAMQTVLLSRGLMPGRDVSVVCCDDIRDFQLAWPELSRAGFDRIELGSLASDMLIERIRSGQPQVSQTLDFEWCPGQTIVPFKQAKIAGGGRHV